MHARALVSIRVLADERKLCETLRRLTGTNVILTKPGASSTNVVVIVIEFNCR